MFRVCIGVVKGARVESMDEKKRRERRGCDRRCVSLQTAGSYEIESNSYWETTVFN